MTTERVFFKYFYFLQVTMLVNHVGPTVRFVSGRQSCERQFMQSARCHAGLTQGRHLCCRWYSLVVAHDSSRAPTSARATRTDT